MSAYKHSLQVSIETFLGSLLAPARSPVFDPRYKNRNDTYIWQQITIANGLNRDTPSTQSCCALQQRHLVTDHLLEDILPITPLWKEQLHLRTLSSTLITPVSSTLTSFLLSKRQGDGASPLSYYHRSRCWPLED